MKLKTYSRNRYNGGAAAKRKYGSSTITEFLVVDEDTGRKVTVRVGGKTPGDRSTAAKQAAEILFLTNSTDGTEVIVID